MKQMNNQENNKVTMNEALACFFKALKIWYKSHPALLISSIVKSFFSAVSPYAALWFSAQLLNEIAGERNWEKLIILAVSTAVTAAVMAILGAISTRWYNAQLKMKYMYSRNVYLNKLHSMDFQRMDDPKTYEAYTKLKQVNNFNGMGLSCSINGFDSILSGLFKVIGGAALTYSLFTQKVPSGSRFAYLNSPLALIVIIAVMAAAIFLSFAFSNKSENIFIKNTSVGTFGNRLFNIPYKFSQERKRALDIRTYEQEKPVRDKILSTHLFDTKGPYAKLSRGPIGLLSAAGDIMSRALTGIIYLFVCFKAWAGAFGVGSVAQYISAMTSLAGGLAEILTYVSQMKSNAVFLKQTFEFLELPNEMYQGSLTVEKRSDRNYEIEFRNVSFKYPGNDFYALKNLNLKFKIGERLAIVGLNGSGKTTMIKLLCRLYDPTEGEILLNGINIRKYNYDQYLSIFSVVFQDFQLLALPLGENIAGSTNVDKARAEQCLSDAGLSDRLETLPHGLDTCLYREFDKEGVEISGGEAQKIAIARAIYKNSPFIILDEPTAALDPISEAEVYQSFDRLIEDRTAIYISHRLSSCRFCDRIAVFNGGQIVQFGTHDELVAEEGGEYSRLWQAQAQYYT